MQVFDHTPPNPDPVLDLSLSFRNSQMMFAGIELGIFELLAKVTLPAAEIATQLKLNIDATERLLQGLAMLDLLKQTDAGYTNTPASQAYLTLESPRRFLGYINYSHKVLWKLWENLPDAIREGTHRWKQAFGSDGPIFSSIFRSDFARREFIMGMHSYGMISSPQLANAIDLSQHKRFVDLGGATGHLVCAVCQRWPHLQGVLFDLPEVVGIATEVISETPVASQVVVQSGDFFADALPEADVYALGRIVHDWTEEKIITLLAKIYAALPAGGALLIGEKILDDTKTGPEWSVSQNLNMLLVTEGKERTVAEYAALLEKAGFSEVHCTKLPASPLDAVFAVK